MKPPNRISLAWNQPGSHYERNEKHAKINYWIVTEIRVRNVVVYRIFVEHSKNIKTCINDGIPEESFRENSKHIFEEAKHIRTVENNTLKFNIFCAKIFEKKQDRFQNRIKKKSEY